MITANGIRIQNIYYMLSYAFSVLKENGYETVASETFEHTADLFAVILSKGLAMQVKRGLLKDYLPMTESLSTLRGKIDLSASIKERTMIKRQLVCSFDEFSLNTKPNQILKTTLSLLLKQNIKPQTKKELKNLCMILKDVDTLNPYRIDWHMRFDRNNASYQMLMAICYLVIKGLLPNEEQGDLKMKSFLDEKRMSTLYEKFLLAYYRHHFPMLNVSPSRIQWNIEKGNEFASFLPQMRSDIMISTKDGLKTLIIDAKYYTKSMTTSQYGNKQTFHSNNLYQIFSYVKNKDAKHTGDVSGMLLYAKTDEAVTPDAEYIMDGNRIMVKSLDLGCDFLELSEKLRALICPMIEKGE